MNKATHPTQDHVAARHPWAVLRLAGAESFVIHRDRTWNGAENMARLYRDKFPEFAYVVRYQPHTPEGPGKGDDHRGSGRVTA